MRRISIFSLTVLLCLSLLLANGCQDGLPRAQEGAVIRDPVRTTSVSTPTDTFPLPNDYYFEDNYLPNKAAVINDLLEKSGTTGEAFVFVTDPHTEQNRNAGQTPNLVHYLCTQTDLRRAIIGGDVYVGTSANYANTMAEAFSDGTVHYVMGNHEYDRDTTDAVLTAAYDEGKREQVITAVKIFESFTLQGY